MSLPRKYTIKNRSAFLKVRENGDYLVGKFMIVSTLEENSLSFPMFGFITTKKIGKANKRNLLRRRLRAIVKCFFPYFINHHRYIIIVARKDALYASFEKLKFESFRLAKKLKIIDYNNFNIIK